MHAIEEKKKFSKELTTIQPSALMFKVVVNNYRQQKKERLEIVDEDDSTAKAKQFGLPPQPKRYLKYPEYDWF